MKDNFSICTVTLVLCVSKNSSQTEDLWFDIKW